jgi:hypothetical protein
MADHPWVGSVQGVAPLISQPPPPPLITQPTVAWTKAQLLRGRHKTSRLSTRAQPPTAVSLRKRILAVISPRRGSSHATQYAAQAYAWLLTIATLLCVALLIVSSFDFSKDSLLFAISDGTLSSLFLCDYVMRLYCAPDLPRMRSRGYHNPWAARLRWVFTWEAILCACLTGQNRRHSAQPPPPGSLRTYHAQLPRPSRVSHRRRLDLPLLLRPDRRAVQRRLQQWLEPLLDPRCARALWPLCLRPLCLRPLCLRPLCLRPLCLRPALLRSSAPPNRTLRQVNPCCLTLLELADAPRAVFRIF